MPWLPDLESARLLYQREPSHVPRLPFFDGIRHLDLEILTISFAGEPRIDDPRYGRVEGRAALEAYVAATRAWLEEATTGQFDLVSEMYGDTHAVEEFTLHLRRDGRVLPVAVSAELAKDTRMGPIRVYYGSAWD